MIAAPGAPSNRRPRRLGAYVLGRRIGAGGMATVFAARQTGPRGVGRVVAVKVMSTALAGDAVLQEAFVREATLATRIEHPNVVRTYEVGEVDGEIFIAMELVLGQTLSALQKSVGAAPIAVALRIVSDVARGLHAAHELRDADGAPLGVVHQDVTPHNVIVGYDGVSKLLDFGVARVQATDGSRTEHIRGKPAYLAPEQLELGRIDRRTDIFSLGIVLYELLTGKRCFSLDGSMTRAILARVNDEVRDVRDTRPDVPAAVAAVVAKAMRLNPDERFQTAEELRRAVSAARAECSIEDADDAIVGDWVSASSTLPWTLRDLEHELAGAESFESELARVADMPTLQDPVTDRERPHRRRAALLGAIASGAMALVVAGVLAGRGRREPSPADVASAAPSLGVAGPFAPEAASPAASIAPPSEPASATANAPTALPAAPKLARARASAAPVDAAPPASASAPAPASASAAPSASTPQLPLDMTKNPYR